MAGAQRATVSGLHTSGANGQPTATIGAAHEDMAAVETRTTVPRLLPHHKVLLTVIAGAGTATLQAHSCAGLVSG